MKVEVTWTEEVEYKATITVDDSEFAEWTNGGDFVARADALRSFLRETDCDPDGWQGDADATKQIVGYCGTTVISAEVQS